MYFWYPPNEEKLHGIHHTQKYLVLQALYKCDRKPYKQRLTEIRYVCYNATFALICCRSLNRVLRIVVFYPLEFLPKLTILRRKGVLRARASSFSWCVLSNNARKLFIIKTHHSHFSFKFSDVGVKVSPKTGGGIALHYKTRVKKDGT